MHLSSHLRDPPATRKAKRTTQASHGCICVSSVIEAGSWCPSGSKLGLSAFDQAAAWMELAFKLDEAVDGTEMAAVCLAVEGGEHARVVPE